MWHLQIEEGMDEDTVFGFKISSARIIYERVVPKESASATNANDRVTRSMIHSASVNAVDPRRSALRAEQVPAPPPS